MSVRHIGLILDHLEAPPAVKVVALILADHADSDGVCWPSYRRIAERSCMSERTVRRHVHELIDTGIVRKLRTGSVTSSDGRRVYESNCYRLDADVLSAMPTLCKVVTDDHLGAKVVTGDHPKVVTDGHPRWSGVATKPSKEPSTGTVTSITGSALEPAKAAEIQGDFEEWWDASGRIGSKADAGTLYRWWRTTGEASHDELLTAVINYRRHCEATDCFMQHGRTFLVKPSKNQAARWPEWAAGEEHGSTDVAGAGRLADVVQVGLEWIEGSNGDDGHPIDAGSGAIGLEPGCGQPHPAVGEDACGGLPQISLASGE